MRRPYCHYSAAPSHEGLDPSSWLQCGGMEHAKEALPEGSNFVTSGGHKSPAVATAGEIMLNFAQRSVDSIHCYKMRAETCCVMVTWLGAVMLFYCSVSGSVVYIKELFSYSIYKMIRAVRCLCLWLRLLTDCDFTLVLDPHITTSAQCGTGRLFWLPVFCWRGKVSLGWIQGVFFFDITALAVTLVELTQVWCGSLVKLMVKHIGHRLLLKAVFFKFQEGIYLVNLCCMATIMWSDKWLGGMFQVKDTQSLMEKSTQMTENRKT